MAPVLVEIFKRVPQLVVQTGGTLTTGPPVSADEFEDLFRDPILADLSDAKVEKVVTVIDNLDRLQSDQVVEVLGSVKTFLEIPESRFVFVVPCDDNAILQHIESRYSGLGEQKAREFAREFLRKFFNVTLPITQFYEPEMRSFTLEELGKLQLMSRVDSAEQATRLARLIANVYGENPRSVKQFLNNLSARAALADERIKEGILSLPGGLLDLLTLGKLLIIEERWPSRYESMRRTPSLLEHWQWEGSRLAKTESSLEADFADFLLASEDIRPAAGLIRAYILLKQTEDEASLPDYEEFRDQVEGADVESVNAALTSGDEFSQVRLRLLPHILNEAIDRGDAGHSRNALVVVLAVSVNMSAGLRAYLAEFIGPLVSMNPALISLLDADSVGSLLDLLQASRRTGGRLQFVVELLLEDLKEGSDSARTRNRTVIAELAARVESFSQAQVTQFRSVIHDVYGTDTVALLAVTSQAAARQMLLTPELIRRYVNSLTLERLKEE